MKKLCGAILFLFVSAGILIGAKGSDYILVTSITGSDYVIGVDISNTSMATTGTTSRFKFENFPISILVQAALDLKQNLLHNVEFVSEYGNSVNTAVAAIGATETTLIIDESTALTASVTWPSTLALKVQNGAVISGAYTLALANCSKFEGAPGCFGSDITVTGLQEAYPDYWTQNVLPGTTNMSVAIGKAHVASANGAVLWKSATYAMSAGESITLTGSCTWMSEGITTIKYTGASAATMIYLALGGDFTISGGKVILDGNSTVGTGLRVDNDKATMADAVDMTIRDLEAKNFYSDANSRNAMGFYAYGAFNKIMFDNCKAKNISRAAVLTGSPACIGYGYGHGGIVNYAKSVTFINPVIDTVTNADATGAETEVDMDGINITGPDANANAGVKMPTSLVVLGGTFRNCTGRSIKSQMESNLVDGPTFIKDSDMLKKAAASIQEVDFQYGSGVLTNFKCRYGLNAGGTTPFPTSWAICNASVRGFAVEEGALVVTNGEITNDIPQATDLMPYLVTLVRTAGNFQSVIVSNNTFLGVGAVDTFILNNSDYVKKIVANDNYINDLGVSLIYGTSYPSAIVQASGNYLSGTSRLICDGGTYPFWYGEGNYGFSTLGKSRRKGAATAISDGGTITHYMGAAPNSVRITGSVADEIVAVTAISATTFTVSIKKRTDGSAGTAQTIYWDADMGML